ncbi:hypothetical protein [Cryobacterium tagatosivorans]|nr:hypothetical protein [Cryobacterium tagatosivorans]
MAMTIILAVLAFAGIGGTIWAVARDGYRQVQTRDSSGAERER